MLNVLYELNRYKYYYSFLNLVFPANLQIGYEYYKSHKRARLKYPNFSYPPAVRRNYIRSICSGFVNLRGAYFFSLLAPYRLRLCLRLATPWVS